MDIPTEKASTLGWLKHMKTTPKIATIKSTKFGTGNEKIQVQ